MSSHHIISCETASIKDQQQALSSLQVRGQISEFKFGQVDLGGPDPGDLGASGGSAMEVSTRDGPALTEFTDVEAVLQIGMTLWHDGSSSSQDHLST